MESFIGREEFEQQMALMCLRLDRAERQRLILLDMVTRVVGRLDAFESGSGDVFEELATKVQLVSESAGDEHVWQVGDLVYSVELARDAWRSRHLLASFLSREDADSALESMLQSRDPNNCDLRSLIVSVGTVSKVDPATNSVVDVSPVLIV